MDEREKFFPVLLNVLKCEILIIWESCGFSHRLFWRPLVGCFHYIRHYLAV